MWWAASARRSDPLGQSAKSLELRETTHDGLVVVFLAAQRNGPSRTRRHGPSVDAGPDGRSAVHAAASRDRPRRAHRLGRRSRGSDARRRHSAMVHGLCGVGSETARLLMLCGLTQVVLNDDTPVTHEDLNTQLLLTDADVGRRRSEALAERLAVAFDGISTTEVTAMVRAAPGPRGRRRLRNRRHHRHDRDIVDARARRLADDLRETSCVCALAHGAFAFVHAAIAHICAKPGEGWPHSWRRADASPPAAAARARGERHDPRRRRRRWRRIGGDERVRGDDVRGDAPRTGEGRSRGTGREKNGRGTKTRGARFDGDGVRVHGHALVHGDASSSQRRVFAGRLRVRAVGGLRGAPCSCRRFIPPPPSSLGKALGSGLQKWIDGSSDGLPSHVTLRYSDDAAVAPALVLALRDLDALEPGDDPCAWAGELFDEVQNEVGWLENPSERCREAVSNWRGCKVRIPAVCTVAASLAAHRALRALMHAGGADDGWIVYDCVEMIVPISKRQTQLWTSRRESSRAAGDGGRADPPRIRRRRRARIHARDARRGGGYRPRGVEAPGARGDWQMPRRKGRRRRRGERLQTRLGAGMSVEGGRRG